MNIFNHRTAAQVLAKASHSYSSNINSSYVHVIDEEIDEYDISRSQIAKCKKDIDSLQTNYNMIAMEYSLAYMNESEVGKYLLKHQFWSINSIVTNRELFKIYSTLSTTPGLHITLNDNEPFTYFHDYETEEVSINLPKTISMR